MIAGPVQLVHAGVTYRRHTFEVRFNGFDVGHSVDIPCGHHDFYESAWAQAYLAAIGTGFSL